MFMIAENEDMVVDLPKSLEAFLFAFALALLHPCGVN